MINQSIKTKDNKKINKAEIRKSQSNIRYWLENYYYIDTVDGMKCGSDVWYPKSIDALVKITKGKCPLICGARQSGKTTIISAFALWMASLFVNQNILIGTVKADNAKIIIDKIYKAYQHIPDDIKPSITKLTSTSISFETGSTIYAKTTSVSNLRSHSGMVLLDELAYTNINLKSDFPNVLIGAVKDHPFVAVSSFNEKDNFFNRMYMALKPNDRFLITWEDIPSFTKKSKWKENMIKSIGNEKFSIEYECRSYNMNVDIKNNSNKKNLKNIDKKEDTMSNKNIKKEDNIEQETETTMCESEYINIYDIAKKTGLDKDAYMFNVLNLVLNINENNDQRYKDIEKIKELCEIWLEQNSNN